MQTLLTMAGFVRETPLCGFPDPLDCLTLLVPDSPGSTGRERAYRELPIQAQGELDLPRVRND